MVLNEVVRDVIREILVDTSAEGEVIVSDWIESVNRGFSLCREGVMRREKRSQAQRIR